MYLAVFIHIWYCLSLVIENCIYKLEMCYYFSYPQLRVAKEAAAAPVVSTQPSHNRNSQEINEWDQPLMTPSPQVAAPLAPAQQPYVTDYGAEAEDGFGFEDCKLFYTLDQ